MNTENLFGLVLAGGESRRMGTDKALIQYYNQPQFKRVFDLLIPFCQEVFVSVNQRQVIELPCIKDNPKLNAFGPALGIASAFEFRKKPWLVLAIDYPFISEKEINHLIEFRKPDTTASVYVNENGFFEPGIGIYEAEFNEFLLEEIYHGKGSLQQALISSGASKVLPLDAARLLNVNTPEALEFVKLKIG